MRTTLSIDDDVLRAAKSLATAEERTVGEVISDLARRGLRPGAHETTAHGLPVFKVSEKAAPLTLDMVHRALDD